MLDVLVFDIKGEYAHYKKIYATTSAISYMIPPKTALYGYVGAILGLEKNDNQYLSYFQNKSCLIGISICAPIVMQRINTNLRPSLGRLGINDNRKPTTIEYVYKPWYRIYFTHTDNSVMEKLESNLKNKQSVYTPTLGLASLISDFQWQGTYKVDKRSTENAVKINSVIPRKKFIKFSDLTGKENRIVEQSMYAIEMDMERNVIERDDIFLDKACYPIEAFVTEYYKIGEENVILF